MLRHSVDTLTDEELVTRYKQSGDKQLVGELYKRYTGFVFAVCLKHLHSRAQSEDAVMQVFEKLFSDLKKHSVQNFKSWLYTVAKNHCLHIIRSRKKDFVLPDDNSGVQIMEFATNMYHDSDGVLEQHLARLELEIPRLSEEQRICIELFYLKKKSYTEVASITGYTLGQVKSYIQNGKRNLKLSLTGNEQ